MTSSYRQRGFDWEARGSELGETFSAHHAIVVTGIDPVSTGQVAVGIARAQSMHRRVALGDLFAESPPIQELVQSDDPHGLVDSFLYGVSLSKIAYPVAGPGQLFVMQSGTEPPDYDEILPNPRWHRLAAGFRESGALLVLAVPAGAPHIETLVAATDGAVLVGEGVPRRLPVATVLASLRDSSAAAADAAAEAAQAAIANLAAELESASVVKPNKGWSAGRIAAIAGVFLTVALIAAGLWLFYRPFASGERRNIGPKPDSTKGLARVIAPSPDTAVRDAAADSVARGAAAAAIPVVHNPEDSAAAAAFSVELIKANTQAGAILKLQQDGKLLPAATFAPVLRQGARWFDVVSGAYATRAEADSLLTALRTRKVLDPDRGAVVRLPYAFLIDSVSADAVNGLLKTYADQGQPVYALRQASGKVWLLSGAFETPEQSALYAESLRASVITPVLVYRKGRTF